MTIDKIACNEIKKINNTCILGKGSNLPWDAPCLLQGKKDGGVCFLTNLSKLTEAILCSPYPLPNIDNVI
eukprot:5011039-Ditylum_brightwellii.AAC.1